MKRLVMLLVAASVVSACGVADANEDYAVAPTSVVGNRVARAATSQATASPSPIVRAGSPEATASPMMTPSETAAPTRTPRPSSMLGPFPFDEAARYLPFTPVMPEPLPSSLRFDDALVFRAPSPDEAILRFALTAGIQPARGVQLSELVVPHPVNPNPHLSRTTSLAGVEVTKITDDTSWCWLFRAYEWQQDGLYLRVSSDMSGDVSDAMLLDLVADTMGIEPRLAHESELAVATPEEQEFGRPTAGGRYCGISIDDARALVDFQVTMPGALPAEFAFDHVYVVSNSPRSSGDPKATRGADEDQTRTRLPNEVVTLFRDLDAYQYWSFTVFTQSSSDRLYLDDLLAQQPVVLINDVEVVKIVSPIGTPPDLPQLFSFDYYWKADGVTFRLEGTTDVNRRPVQERAYEELIAATLP
jgi:hypothetical protein